MVDFSDKDGVGSWVESLHPDLGVAIAMRSALRVLPLIVGADRQPEFGAAVVFPVFRAVAFPWTTLAGVAPGDDANLNNSSGTIEGLAGAT